MLRDLSCLSVRICLAVFFKSCQFIGVMLKQIKFKFLFAAHNFSDIFREVMDSNRKPIFYDVFIKRVFL